MFLQLAQHLNRVTGDNAIDLLKRWVVEQGAPLLLPTVNAALCIPRWMLTICFVSMHRGQD